jgi:DNA-binding response OmpR family regulator
MRILVVDDEPMVRFLLVRFLEEEGHTVDEAADGIEALEHLSRRAYDLVITDVHMPRMSGIDLVRALRRQGNRVPVLVMDSYPDLFTESEVGAEAFAMLAKPFDLSEVRRVLQMLEPQPV